MTLTIPTGVPTAILQNVVYALPAKACIIFSIAAIEISNLVGASFVAEAASATTGLQVSGGFVRCTSANTTVTCKAS
jgi:hypothetical protein